MILFIHLLSIIGWGLFLYLLHISPNNNPTRTFMWRNIAIFFISFAVVSIITLIVTNAI